MEELILASRFRYPLTTTETNDRRWHDCSLITNVVWFIDSQDAQLIWISLPAPRGMKNRRESVASVFHFQCAHVGLYQQ
jgi:hypothetical protein